jgi:hypothetical protein
MTNGITNFRGDQARRRLARAINEMRRSVHRAVLMPGDDSRTLVAADPYVIAAIGGSSPKQRSGRRGRAISQSRAEARSYRANRAARL